MNYRVILLVNLLVVFGDAANILGVFPLPGKSHYVMFERILMKLAEKGHNVDVATHFPAEKAPERFKQLSLNGSLPQFVNNMPIQLFEGISHKNLVELITGPLGVEFCKVIFQTDVLQNLKKSKTRYDLVVTEIFGSDCMLGFGHLFKAPTVSFISSVALPWANDRIGNPDNPSYIPNYFMSLAPKMGFWERLQNTVFLLLSKYYYRCSSQRSNEVSREFFGEDLPDLQELARNTSLILANSHFSINYARPTVPNFIEVGGIHIQEPKPLSKYFEDMLKTESKGIIYLTMGSMILTESFDFDKIQGMFDAFAELPYKVVWKAVKDKFPEGLKFPKNVHFEKWMPQMDILCHPSVKLFVSHGGLMGSQEAIYCGVPRLGIPLFADQLNNINFAEKMGQAIKVEYKDISKETILKAATKILDDASYKENCDRASKLFKDRPMSALDTAVYWMEYVIRHKGAPHLRTAGADLSWLVYNLLDVVLVFLGAVLVTFCIAKAAFKCLCGDAPKPKSD